jgi:hypothetical protein
MTFSKKKIKLEIFTYKTYSIQWCVVEKIEKKNVFVAKKILKFDSDALVSHRNACFLMETLASFLTPQNAWLPPLQI